PSQRCGIGNRPLPALLGERLTNVDGKPDDRDQPDHHQCCEWQDLAGGSLGWGKTTHGALGSIRTSVVVLRQKPGTPHEGASNCRPGKKIGTGCLIRTCTDQAT